jgi:four helix bundle protein
MATYNHFYELPVYKTCREFRKLISKTLNESIPKKEEFLLKAQALDSSRSITANIAEGFGRYHHQENIQFCRQSRGSLSEVMDHMITAFDDSYINKETLAAISQESRNAWLN